MNKYILQIDNLKKVYHTNKEEINAVENFSLYLKENELYGLCNRGSN